RPPLRVPCYKRLCPRAAAAPTGWPWHHLATPLQGALAATGLAVGGRPCKGPGMVDLPYKGSGRGRPPPQVA
ncbi:hypothetical protein BHM03_00013318, partial [Ensete ventricosum]